MKSDFSEKNHLPVLDGVRGGAILMVLLFHFWQGLENYRACHVVLPKFFAVWSAYPSVGQKGVDLFFVLSGFLITGILLRTKGTAHYFKNFYIRRSLRIFPLYYVVVIVCLAAGAVFSLPQYQWHNCWSYLVYLQNVMISFWPRTIAGPAHFWTLAVEEQFYLFWPLVVFWLNRRHLVWAAISLMVTAFLLRAACLWAGGEAAFYFTFCRMDTLAMGALLAIYFGEPDRWRSIGLWSRRLAVPIFACVVVFYLVSARLPSPGWIDLGYTIYAAFFALVLVLALSGGGWNPLPAFFQNSWLRGIGRISYAIYVFHPFIFHKIEARLYAASWSPLKGHLWVSLISELLLCLGATVLVAWISWVSFERPFIQLKHRFQYETRRSAPNPVVTGQ